MDARFVQHEVLEACHDDLRRHFEPMIKATAALLEVHVFTAITLRLVRLSKATTLLCRAGLGEEALLPFRSATECIVNLLYILHVGPAHEGRTQSALAQQFLAYGDLAYAKMLRKRSETARAAYRNRTGMSDAEFDDFLREKERLAEDAARVHGCAESRWHRRFNLQDMAILVRDNAPTFVHETIAEVVFTSFVSANSATHGDALSLRSQYKALGNEPLELTFVEEDSRAEVVATQAMWAWKAMGTYYNQLDFVEKCFNRHLMDVVRRRTSIQR